jgi:hypothetical protein
MMKKLLILMLVFALASIVSAATITYEFRAADGVTPISVVDVSISTSFTFAIEGTYENENGTERVYENDSASVNGIAQMSSSHVKADMGSAAGSFGDLPGGYDTTWDGYTVDWGDTGAKSGDIMVFDLSIIGGATSGTVTLEFYDSDYETVLHTQSINVTPEPMTVALLGLGGLFLRRRK